MLISLLTLLACSTDCGPDQLKVDGDCVPAGQDSPTPDDSGVDDTGDDTGAPVQWLTLPAECVATGATPDPLVQLGFDQHTQLEPNQWFVELIDLELHDGRVYAVGQGGLMIYDVADPSAPTLLGAFVGPFQRFHRVEVLTDQLVAVTHRDAGLLLVDVSDPANPVLHARVDERGLEGMVWSGDRLVVSSRRDGLQVYELSDSQSPGLVATTPGLESTWELSPARDGWSYAADNLQGVVPIDLSDPDAPALGDPVLLEGATLHVSVDGDWLYASQGGQGVTVLDRSDPAAPTPVATVHTGGSAVMTAAGDGLLWVVDHEGLMVFDVSDPRDPQPIGRETTPQFALAVRAQGREAWVGDWSILSGWRVDPTLQAPELDLSYDIAILPTEGGETELRVSNRGALPLQLTGATVDDPRVSVQVSAESIPVNGSARLKLEWSDSGDLETGLCLASTDPDQPTRTVNVLSGETQGYLGKPAPDFTMTDLDGVTWRLSEQLGQVVVLDYFATW